MTTVSGFREDRQGYVIEKDPTALLDYTFDWSSDGWLGTDSIISFSTVVPTGLALASSQNTDGTVTLWLSGGTAGQVYTVSCIIVTAQAREDKRSFRVQVVDR